MIMQGGSYTVSITTALTSAALLWLLWSFDPKQQSRGGGPRQPVIGWFPPVTYRLANLLVLLTGIGVAGVPFIHSFLVWSAEATSDLPIFGNGWLAVLGGLAIVTTLISLIRNTVNNTLLSISFSTPLLTPFVAGLAGDGSRTVLDWISIGLGGAIHSLF
ncbi:hypothetical protein ACIQF6_28495 [Kitasatospora sp. NPDC092948]|uniref:hypothetical protein n=1 Tax=Kitasatospora sp. NPDC092948 TaxID=3364088 RepID=UPI0038305C88